MTYAEFTDLVGKNRGYIQEEIFFNLYVTPNNMDEEIPDEQLKKFSDHYNLKVKEKNDN